MKKFGLFLVLIPFILWATAGSSAFPESADPSDAFEKVDELFSQWNNSHSPGCALAVVKDGEIIYKRGYGMADLEHHISITPETVFYIGSVSKQFVTMCILLLEEEGKLFLDDDVRKYIPEFPEYDRPMTIKHLIHHTSGIRDYLTLWTISGRNYLDHVPKKAVLDMICSQKELNFSPGEQYLYSNSCYFLLAVVVERITGQTFREFADSHIFQPLGMEDSHFQDDNTYLIENRAFGYFKKEDNSFGNMLMRFDLVGSGGLYTNVEDLYLWDQNFYHNKLGAGSPELIDKMKTKGRLNNGEEIDYAFALNIGEYRGAQTVSHGGSLGGYRAMYVRFPEFEFSVIILSNLAEFNPSEMAYRVADILLGHEFKEPQKKESQKQKPESDRSEEDQEPIQMTDTQLAEYTGTYYSDELEVF
jgi:CubicO group peptidase (beta-lactamase class C family)